MSNTWERYSTGTLEYQGIEFEFERNKIDEGYHCSNFGGPHIFSLHLTSEQMTITSQPNIFFMFNNKHVENIKENVIGKEVSNA